MYVVIGSLAMNKRLGNVRNPKDYDIICSKSDADVFVEQMKTVGKFEMVNASDKKYLCKLNDTHYEFEFAEMSESGKRILDYVKNDENTIKQNDFLFPSLDFLYMLKMSHRFKGSPHFLKNMNDIHLMRKNGAKIEGNLVELLKVREKDTYVKKGPSLNKNKDNFFYGDGVNYIYDHDWLHTVVKHLDRPAYTFFQKDGHEVLSDKNKFFALPEEIKRYAVLEEAYVLALERSQIPYDLKPNRKKSFLIALEKISTVTTSGWFREYCWENYYEVLKMYSDNYVDKYLKEKHNAVPYKNSLLEDSSIKIKM